MNYDLAKELRDAGFPFQYSYKSNLTKEDAEKIADELSRGRAVIVPRNEEIYPTLSELIAACGDGLDVLSHDRTKENVVWICNNYSTMGSMPNPYLMTGGSTPEEAVARLWLVLNKK